MLGVEKRGILRNIIVSWYLYIFLFFCYLSDIFEGALFFVRRDKQSSLHNSPDLGQSAAYDILRQGPAFDTLKCNTCYFQHCKDLRAANQ